MSATREQLHSPGNRWVRFLHERTLLLLVLAFFGGSAWITWSFARFSKSMVETAAVEDAETLAAVLEEFRSIYTSEVVERVRSHGITVTHDYESSEGSIPLPATLSLRLGEQISSSGTHGTVRLFSDHPFPWREDGGLRDDFEREALQHLRRLPDEPFHRIEDFDGRRSLRYAIADRMRSSCIDCHNTHPQSPKTDWKVGDVRGVLEIVRPMDGLTSSINASMRELFAYLILLALVGMVGLIYLQNRLRGSLRTLPGSGRAELEALDLETAGASFKGLLVLELITLAGVFVFDLLIPLGVAAGVPYVLAVLLSARSSRQAHTYSIAVVATCLTLLGLVLSPEGGVIWAVLANRVLAILAIWVTAIVCIWQRRAVVQKSRLSTEKHLSELHNQELRESAARIASILEAAVDAIITIDGRGIIQSFNPAAERIFGYTASEVIGENVSRLMPSPDRENHDQYIRNYLETGHSKIIGIGREVVGLTKDGREFPMDLSISAVDSSQGNLFTGIVRDITERKAIDQMKTEFVGTVSHELRTPLTSIRGALGLIEGGAAGELPEGTRSLLGIALKNSERLVRLVNDILDVEKIESGKMQFHMEALDLTKLVRETVAATGPFASQYKVVFELTSRLPDARVEGDCDRIVQVVTNLLSNAAKYSPEGETVSVSIRPGSLGARVEVSDRGPGISDEFRPRVFGKFAQADSSDTRRIGGTGLGLSICRSIIQEHGGEIGFESVVGEGTTFYFELPPSSQTTGSRTTGASSADEGAVVPAGGERVLVVEDDEDVAHLLRMMLEQSGFAADVAGDAPTARERLRAGEYAAMTLDVGLPGESGLELLRELREREGTRELPVVVVSAKVVEGDREMEGSALGVVDWLEKPIDQERLVRAVQGGVRASNGRRRARVLHVEDDADLRRMIAVLLAPLAEVVPANDLASARSRLTAEAYDLVLLDLGLPDGEGSSLLELCSAPERSVPVVIFSASELRPELREMVAGALLKSRASNERVIQAIRELLDSRKPASTCADSGALRTQES